MDASTWYWEIWRVAIVTDCSRIASSPSTVHGQLDGATRVKTEWVYVPISNCSIHLAAANGMHAGIPLLLSHREGIHSLAPDVTRLSALPQATSDKYTYIILISTEPSALWRLARAFIVFISPIGLITQSEFLRTKVSNHAVSSHGHVFYA